MVKVPLDTPREPGDRGGSSRRVSLSWFYAQVRLAANHCLHKL